MKSELVCKHANLKRSCYTCELESSLAQEQTRGRRLRDICMKIDREIGGMKISLSGEGHSITHTTIREWSGLAEALQSEGEGEGKS